MSKGKAQEIISRDEASKIGDWFSNNYQFLYRIGFAILRDPFKVEDAIQETTFALIKNKERYCLLGDIDFFKLSIVILKHKCVDQLRMEERTIFLEENLQYEKKTENDKLVLFEFCQQFWDVFSRLDTGSQRLLYLKYVEKHSYRDIAVMLDCDSRDVQRMLYRAREQFKRRWREEEDK